MRKEITKILGAFLLHNFEEFGKLHCWLQMFLSKNWPKIWLKRELRKNQNVFIISRVVGMWQLNLFLGGRFVGTEKLFLIIFFRDFFGEKSGRQLGAQLMVKPIQ